jgi:hypothetical protein
MVSKTEPPRCLAATDGNLSNRWLQQLGPTRSTRDHDTMWFRCANYSVTWLFGTYCKHYGSMESSVHYKTQLAFRFSANKINNRVRLPCIIFMQTKWASDWNTNMKNGILANNNITSNHIWIYTNTHTLLHLENKIRTKWATGNNSLSKYYVSDPKLAALSLTSSF